MIEKSAHAAHETVASPGQLKPTPPPRPWQFSLQQLLLVTAGVCLFAAAFRLFGFPVLIVAGVLVIVTIVGLAIARQSIAELLVVSLIVCLLIALFIPTLSSQHGPGRRSTCSNNLKQIGIALHNYHDVYGAFPPAYVADEHGRPMHSWRVLLLPFLEQQNLYAQYRFDEPWDGPNNRTLAGQMSQIYGCPSDADAPLGTTSYLAVVGPETMWPGEKAVSLSDIKDGSSNTLIVVESHASGIHWMEPRDLHTLQMPMAVNAKQGQGICSCHPSSNGGIAQFLRADCSVGQFTTDAPPAEIRAALTRAARD
jgi:hypothetical protein